MFVHHPEFGRPGHRAVLDVHPAVPGQQALQDVPHDEDDADPQPGAHQHPPHCPLAVTGQIPPGEGEGGDQRRTGGGRVRGQGVGEGQREGQGEGQREGQREGQEEGEGVTIFLKLCII